MKYCLICVLACMFSLSAIADNDWIYLSNGNNGTVYLQEGSVTVDMDSGLVEAWTKSEYTGDYRTIDKVRYQCAKNQYQLLESYQYSKDGSYIRGGKKTAAKWASVIPDSLAVDITRIICTTAAKQELDKIELVEGGYTSDAKYALIRKSFGKYADAVVMNNIQQSMDNMEW